MVSSLNRALFFTTVGGPPPDTDPNAFGFTNATGVDIATLTTSNTITPTGYDTATTWSVGGGGEGSVNGGSYAISGTISPTQALTIRATSSSSYNTTTSHIVTIGIVTSTWSITTGSPAVSYTTAGTYSFVVPAGVTSVNIACIGGGGGGEAGIGYSGSAGGSGAGLGYSNSVSVTGGETLTVAVGAGGSGGTGVGGDGGGGGTSSVKRSATTLVSALGGNGGANNNTTLGAQTATGSVNRNGGNAGRGSPNGGMGGAGGAAAGWSDTGARGYGNANLSEFYESTRAGVSGQGGSGGGGIYGFQRSEQVNWFSGVEADGYQYILAGGGSGAGGTGIAATGANGTASQTTIGTSSTGGGGGSSGTAGGTATSINGGSGGAYGAGGGAGGYSSYTPYYWETSSTGAEQVAYGTGGAGGGGAVRITWNGKTFPSNSG